MGDITSLIFTLAPHLRDAAIISSRMMMIQCPYHSDGQERTPSMAVSMEKPVFFCHACSESGHLVRLLTRFGSSYDMAKMSLESCGYSFEDPRISKETALLSRTANPYRGAFRLDEGLLDVYRSAPVKLLDDGFEIDTLRHFEVGYDDRNLRITFPLRNIYGELVGVSGRTLIEDLEPRYKIYGDELRKRSDFHVPPTYSMDSVKEALLWHYHIVHPFLHHSSTGQFPLAITEGFKACMWLWQCGWPHVVALVGSYLTDHHANLIARYTQDVVLFLDNNKAGIIGTVKAAKKLYPKGLRVSVARYAEHKNKPDEEAQQPDDLSNEDALEAISNPLNYLSWRKKHDRTIHTYQIDAALRRSSLARQGRS